MIFKLLLLFIIVPLLKLMVIIEAGSRIGVLPTALSLLVISISGGSPLEPEQRCRGLES